MRKYLMGMAVLFTAAFAVGVSMPKVDAATCVYKCVCSRPMKCCTTNGVETCKPAIGFQCTQNYPC